MGGCSCNVRRDRGRRTISPQQVEGSRIQIQALTSQQRQLTSDYLFEADACWIVNSSRRHILFTDLNPQCKALDTGYSVTTHHEINNAVSRGLIVAVEIFVKVTRTSRNCVVSRIDICIHWYSSICRRKLRLFLIRRVGTGVGEDRRAVDPAPYLCMGSTYSRKVPNLVSHMQKHGGGLLCSSTHSLEFGSNWTFSGGAVVIVNV